MSLAENWSVWPRIMSRIMFLWVTEPKRLPLHLLTHREGKIKSEYFLVLGAHQGVIKEVIFSYNNIEVSHHLISSYKGQLEKLTYWSRRGLKVLRPPQLDDHCLPMFLSPAISHHCFQCLCHSRVDSNPIVPSLRWKNVFSSLHGRILEVLYPAAYLQPPFCREWHLIKEYCLYVIYS